MSIQIQGSGGVVADVGGTGYRALKVQEMPLEYGAFGHYRLATTVSLLAAQAANGTLLSFRWADASRLAIIHTIRLKCMQTAAATATIMPIFEVFAARSFTTSDSVGTAITLTGNSMKRRTSMGTTLVTDIRKSAAAAGVTAGTRTLDADPFLHLLTNQAITTPNATLYEAVYDAQGDHPLVLAQNEGFIVRGPSVVFGAAGTANLVVGVVWAEVASF